MEADFPKLIALGIAVVIAIGLFAIFTYKPPAASYSSTSSNSSLPLRGPPAPELGGIAGYINSAPFHLSDYIGKKVILIDFWTYTCINCIRTLPYLNAWERKYAGQGLLIVGVHSPEFDFEKDPANVQAAVSKYRVRYPVVLDSDHATWNAYRNRYWPAEYLIDKSGQVVYTHFGEGDYEKTEAKIVELLGELRSGNVSAPATAVNATAVDFTQIGTPELYFGYLFRRQPLGNEPSYMLPDQPYDFAPPSSLYPNGIYLSGRWLNQGDSMELNGEQGSIFLKYHAKAVYLVMSSNATARVFLDGQPVAPASEGADVHDGVVHADEERMYALINSPDYGTHTLELRISGSGFRAYSFTFG